MVSLIDVGMDVASRDELLYASRIVTLSHCNVNNVPKPTVDKSHVRRIFAPIGNSRLSDLVSNRGESHFLTRRHSHSTQCSKQYDIDYVLRHRMDPVSFGSLRPCQSRSEDKPKSAIWDSVDSLGLFDMQEASQRLRQGQAKVCSSIGLF